MASDYPARFSDVSAMIGLLLSAAIAAARRRLISRLVLVVQLDRYWGLLGGCQAGYRQVCLYSVKPVQTIWTGALGGVFWCARSRETTMQPPLLHVVSSTRRIEHRGRGCRPTQERGTNVLSSPLPVSLKERPVLMGEAPHHLMNLVRSGLRAPRLPLRAWHR